ncbi:MAG: formyltetrahydrofolate deformylase [Planctomycetota bacterium]|nr:MAG: formyltetrahydrofolate deformylase [Planctomycetota bacterium]
MSTVTILVSCRDRTGIVAALSDLIYRNSGNILDADQHSEAESGLFLMRMQWSLDTHVLDRDGLRQALHDLGRSFAFTFKLFIHDRPTRIALWCSNTEHCVYDLLLRQRMGELQDGVIACILSNHDRWREVGEHFSLPVYHVPVDPADRQGAEQRQREIMAEEGIDLIVLARYMQILSPELVADWPERIINIHHSFLPAFVGARPYHQAKERGVKVIGATAHYVTQELDQGPIIEQDVTRVSHRDEVIDLVRKGRDLERQVLSRAVALHLQHRVLTVENRTVVFDG